MPTFQILLKCLMGDLEAFFKIETWLKMTKLEIMQERPLESMVSQELVCKLVLAGFGFLYCNSCQVEY